MITYDYYGADGVQYVRAAAEGDRRTSNHYDTDLEESDDGFRTATGVSIKDNYRTGIDARAESADYTYADGYTSADGSATVAIPRIYGTDNNTLVSQCANEFESYYYFVDSDANCVYASAGDGVNRFTKDTLPNLGSYKKVPMLICCGSFDPYGCFDYWYAIRDSFGEDATQPAVNPYFPIPMIDQGHTYPTGYDYDHGFLRHDAFIEFFNHYLKPEEYDFPEIIWSKPVAGTSVAQTNTTVELKFYDKVDVASVEAGVTVTDSEDNVVAGTWKNDEYFTHFTFTPTNRLKAGETYTLTASSAVVKNQNGKFLRQDYVRSFTTTGMNTSSLPVADTYVSSSSADVAMHSKNVYRYVLKVDSKQTAYVTFDKADLADKAALRFEAVYQSTRSGVSFDVYTMDDYKVDEKTLTYHNRPTAQNFAGTVTTDENGYGYLSLANLGLGKTGFVTFVLLPNNGSSLMFESESSRERGVGVVAVGQSDMIAPVADTYVSSANPTVNYGSAPVLLAGSSQTGTRIAYLTYATEPLANRAVVKLSLPTITLSGNSFKVYAFDGYRIDEGTLTWENRPSLDSATFVGYTSASADGSLMVDLSTLEFEGEYVTFAVCSEEEVNVYSQDFSGSVSSNQSESHSYSATGTYRTGAEPKSHGKTTDPANSSNSCFAIQTGTSRIARAKFYNIWSTTADLTEADIGKHYRISFDVKASEDGFVGSNFAYGLMNVIGMYYPAGMSQNLTLTTDWQHVEYDVIVTADIMDAANPFVFAVDHSGPANSRVYIDNLVSVIPGETMTFASREGSTDSCATMMVSGISEKQTLKPVSETMISKSEPSKVFGNVSSITVDRDSIGILTYHVADLRNAAMVLTLPTEVSADTEIRVYALDYQADTATLHYDAYLALEKHLVGTLTSDGSIAVTGAMGNIIGDYVTFALEVVSEHEYSQNFENYTKTLDIKDIYKTYPDHFVIYWNDSDGTLRYRTGYNGSTLSIVEEGDNKFLRSTMTSSDPVGANRFKLYNILRDDRNFTQDDLGKTYHVSFDMRLSVAGKTVKVALFSPFTYTGVSDGTAGKNYKSYSSYTVGEWTHIDYEVTVTQEMIDGQYGMLSVDVAQQEGVSGNLDIDNISSYVVSDSVTFGTRAGGVSYAKLVHTHEYTETPTEASLVPGTTDTYYVNCSCGLLTEQTFTHTHAAPADVVMVKFLKTPATCATPAVYYQSCSECGMALDTTFESGYAPHTPKTTTEENGTVICEVCGTVLTSPTVARWSTDGTTWTYASLAASLAALAGKTGTVEVMQDTTVTASLAVPASSNVTIRTYAGYHENKVLTRGSSFKSGFFTLGTGSTLTFANITVDGDRILMSSIKGGIVNIPSGSTVTLESGAKILNSYAGTSRAYGGAFYLSGGATLNMKDGAEIRGCYARAGGAICLDEGTAESRAVFNMTGGLITGCASGISELASSDEWGSGGAVTVRAYAVMNMSGGVITGNFGGRANAKQDFVNDGAINLFSTSSTFTCCLNLSGTAVIRGNTAYKEESGSSIRTLATPKVASDISVSYWCNNATDVVKIDARFSGSVGISIPNATFGVAVGTDIPTNFKNVVSNLAPKLAVVSSGKLQWTDAAAEIPTEATLGGVTYPTSKRYSVLADAMEDVVDGSVVKILNNTTVSASITLPAAVFTIDGAGYTVTRGSAFANAMFRLDNAGTHLTIQNVTFDGAKQTIDSTETGGMFRVGDGSSLTMNAGTVIQNSYMLSKGSNRGAAVYVAPGGLFTMNDGIIRNCEARSGGAVYLLDGTASKYASFVMNDGLITNCRTVSQQAMGAAVYMSKYANMKMNGGMITKNSSIRNDFGGFSIKINTSNGVAYAPKEEAADGAIAFRENTARLTLSGNAVIRGNTALNMQNPKGPAVDSDIAFFYNSASCVTILPDFVGSVGIRYPNSTYTYTGTLKEGTTVPANNANAAASNVIFTATPVADGAVSVATAQGFTEGQILGSVVDNTSAGKVAMVKNSKLVWKTAVAETDQNGIITRHLTLADALAANQGVPKLLCDASVTLTAGVGDTVKIAENGHKVTVTYTSDALISEKVATETRTVTYTYGGETFEGPILSVASYRALEGIIRAANIKAGTDLTLQLYARFSTEKSGVQMRITMNPGAENETVRLIDGTLYDADTNTYLFAFTGITPQCMGDTVDAQLVYNDTDFGLGLTDYSVSDYCKNLIALYPDNTSLLTLISDLIVYGAAAQTYTEYKTDALVTDAFTDLAGYAPSTGEVVEDTAMTLSAAISENVSITTAGLEFSNVNRLYFKFKTDDLSKTTITIGGKTVTPKLVSGSDNLYVVYSDALMARNFNDVYEVVLTYAGDEGTTSQTLTYSVNNYAYRMQSSTNEAMRALAKATYFYGVSAENYQ